MSQVSVRPQQVASTLNFIAGQFVAAHWGRTLENRSPIDARLLGLVSEAGETEVGAAVTAARAALACGNTVVVKPSEETPNTVNLLGEVMNAVGVPLRRFENGS